MLLAFGALILQVLVTGATGALGPPTIAELLRCGAVERVIAVVRPTGQDRAGQLLREIELLELNWGSRLEIVSADLLRDFTDSLGHDITHVVHAAAITRLQGDEAELERVNVAGTRQMVDWAKSLRDFQQFVYVSTNCVAGKSVGAVPETLREEPPPFVNAYEASKFAAERIVAAAPFPAHIVRLSTCAGNEDGHVHRAGGIHLAMNWLRRGLISMIPGTPTTPIDLISNETAAKLIVKAVAAPPQELQVCQVAAGKFSPSIGALIDLLIDILKQEEKSWRRGQILPPAWAEGHTFAAFRHSVVHTQDELFNQIFTALETLLAPLQYSRIYETTRAEQLWGGPLPLVDWRTLVTNVMLRQMAKDVERRAHV